MLTITWMIVIVLLTWLFGHWEENQYNPNQNLSITKGQNINEIVLERNRFDHYVLNGQINGLTVTFLLDTGASDVVIPAATAKRIGLVQGRESLASTANGIITVYNTEIDRLELGSITLRNVEASINPAMGRRDSVLLGMSALRNIEFTQRGNELTLRQLNQ